MEDITDANYMHAKRVFKDFEIKDLGENLGLVLKKVHSAITFNQKAWLKSYIMNTKLRNKAKYDFEKEFVKLMNNLTFGKSMEHERKGEETI